jgi:hypothetical protein
MHGESERMPDCATDNSGYLATNPATELAQRIRTQDYRTKIRVKICIRDASMTGYTQSQRQETIWRITGNGGAPTHFQKMTLTSDEIRRNFAV